MNNDQVIQAAEGLMCLQILDIYAQT